MHEKPIIRAYDGISPKLAESCRIAPGAVVVGDVEIGADSSVWWGCVIRGDDHFIKIGERTNIQDGTVIHVSLDEAPTVIGNDVTIGHGARLHGCIIEDKSLVGIGAIVLDHAKVETGGFLAAGAMLTPGKVVKSGELWGGSPARKLRDMKQTDMDYITMDAEHYVRVGAKSLPKPSEF